MKESDINLYMQPLSSSSDMGTTYHCLESVPPVPDVPNLVLFFIRDSSQKSRKPLFLQELRVLPLLCTLPPCSFTLHIQKVDFFQRQFQKLMLIRPPGLALGKPFRLTGLGWGIGDLGD